MSKKTELFRNTLIISLGKFSSQLISFFLLPLYTIYLTPKDYGLVDLIITYVTLLAPVLTIQIEMATFRLLIDSRGDENRKKEIITNVFESIALIILILLILYFVLFNFINIKYLPLILINIIFTIISNLLLQVARGLGDNKKFAKGSILMGVTTLVTTVSLVVFAKKGVEGVLLALILAGIFSSVYLFWSLKIYQYIDFGKGSKKIKRELYNYSLPLVPNGISWWVINVSDRTIVTIALGLAANGIYAVANKYATIYSSLFLIFSLAWTESISVHINAKDRDEFLTDTNDISIKMFGALGLIMIAFTPIIFRLFIGHSFYSASNYVPILILAAFFNAIVGVYSAVYVAKKMTKKVANTSVAAALINIILTIGFIKLLGIYAAAIATVIAFLAMAIFRHYDLKKIVKINYKNGLLYKIGGAYILVILLFYIKNPVINIINILIAVSISIFLNWNVITHLQKGVFKFIFPKK